MMAGIYIHIPFCRSRCKYCDFFSTTYLERRHEYVSAIITEARDRIFGLKTLPDFGTLYLGGGTPSTLDMTDMEELMNLFMPIMTSDAEITIEVNPGDLSLEKLEGYRSLGINRLSVGIQSFQDDLLSHLGRRHNSLQAIQGIQMAKSVGFDNVSIDLIYGLPWQTMSQWKDDINIALSLDIQHISCYNLIYEEGTILTKMMNAGVIQPIAEDIENEMYDYLCSVLLANAYVHYEVSNFAKGGCESIHNSNYWNDTPYIGIGAGAHSYDGNTRSWNPSNLGTYISGISARNLLRESETLDVNQKNIEHIMLGLRTSKGIDIHSVTNHERAEQYVSNGLLRCENGRYIATLNGIHILNRIIEDLI